MPIPAQVTRTEQVPNNEKTVEDQRKYYLQEAVKLFELVKTNGSADLLQQASYYEALFNAYAWSGRGHFRCIRK